MSIALGDVNAESLKALVSQGGAELDEFVDRVQKAAGATGSDLIGQANTDVSLDVEAILAGLKGLLAPANAAIPQIVAMLTEITDRGLVITVSLAPAKGSA
jgi:hypothetical protein